MPLFDDTEPTDLRTTLEQEAGPRRRGTISTTLVVSRAACVYSRSATQIDHPTPAAAPDARIACFTVWQPNGDHLHSPASDHCYAGRWSRQAKSTLRPTRTPMTSRFPGCALFVLLCAAPATLSTSAQTPAAIIQCASCGLSGQAAATGNFDASQLTFVPTVRPAFFEDRTVQGEIIGRVVQVSPLMVEMLDMRTRLVDRNLRTVADGDVDDDTVCDIRRIERVDLASKAIASSLRFNDIIFGLMMMNQNAERPDNFIASTTVLTAVRRVSGPVRYFHTPALKGCANRSGRVLEYRSDTNDAVTVFNDGRIVYRDAQFRRFEQERLTAGELSDLMRAFASANFDALPADVGRPEHGPRPGITLVAARYQEVWLAGKTERLAPLVARMNDLATHATSHTYFLLKRGRPQPLTILPWPYRQIRLGGFSGYKDRARMQRGAYVDNPVPNARAMTLLGLVELSQTPKRAVRGLVLSVFACPRACARLGPAENIATLKTAAATKRLLTRIDMPPLKPTSPAF